MKFFKTYDPFFYFAKTPFRMGDLHSCQHNNKKIIFTCFCSLYKWNKKLCSYLCLASFSYCMFVRFIHVDEYSCRLFLLIADRNSIVWMYHNLPIHEHLGIFSFGTFMSCIMTCLLKNTCPHFCWIVTYEWNCWVSTYLALIDIVSFPKWSY